MKEIDDILDVIDTLLGPNGCPWDKKQTVESFVKFLKEEAQEVEDAIRAGDKEELKKELGDMLWTTLMMIKIAEKQGLLDFKEPLVMVKEKMIRRHPHVFGNVKVESAEEVKEIWQKVKEQEKT